MQRYKLLVYLAVWQRPEITEICFMGLNRLRKNPDYDINVLAVISEESMIPLCKKYNVDYCFYNNEPLGEKKNYGLKQALKKDWDYLIEIGSDDLLKDEYLSVFSSYFGQGDLFGLYSFISLNSEDGTCRHIGHRSSYGIGRAISRRVVESLGRLWNDKINRGLDNASFFWMARNGFMEKRVKSEIPLAIDIKSEVNIWPFNYLDGVDYPLQKALEGLSEEEINAIRCLVTKSKSADLIDA